MRRGLAGLVGTALLLQALHSETDAHESVPRWKAHLSAPREVIEYGRRGQSDDAGGPTRLFVVETETDARKMAELHATPKGELLFTTFQFSHKGVYNKENIHSVRHMWENLREVGILNHTIVISYHAPSCQVMWEHGIPCFLDRHLPQPESLPGQYKTDVPHWYQKYAWALKFIEMGYVTVFIEMDMVFLENPLPYYNPSYDLEGLSDWLDRADVGQPQASRLYLAGGDHIIPVKMLQYARACAEMFWLPHDHMQKREDGVNYIEWGPANPADARSSTHINACMSTGFWFIQPTAPAKALLAAFKDLQLNWRNWQVDQQLWNEVLMAFLIGSGRQRQLHFSLLDTARFSNFIVWELRKEAGLRTQPVMLHCGGIHGKHKEEYIRSHGFWRGDAWDGTGAASHIALLSEHFKFRLPSP